MVEKTIVSEKKQNNISQIAMLLLALSPILSMYGTFLNYAVLSLLFISMFLLFKKRGFYFPPSYKSMWVYLAFSYIVVTLKISAIIPGGLNFFAFSIILICVSKQFDLRVFKKYFKILVLISIILFFGQEFMWYTTGERFVPVLPFGHLTTTLTYQELILRNQLLDRSASLFFEPATFANFLLIGLAVDICSEQDRKILTGYSLLIIVVLLMLRSGTGLAGLSTIIIFKIFSILKNLSKAKKVFAALAITLVVGGAVYYYVRTEVGAEMYERTQDELTLDESAHSYVRFMYGALIYNELPLFNKIIGASDETLLVYANRLALIRSSDAANILYMNGWSHSLTHTGLIGFVFLILVLVKLYHRNNDLSKCGIWLFVVLSLFSQTYTQPLMLIVLVIANYYHYNKQKIYG